MSSRNRGRKKPKLSDISRVHPSQDEKSEIIKLLVSPDAIVAATVSASMLEISLDNLVRFGFSRMSDDLWTEMTSDRGPLGTFSQKIVVGYALGIFDNATYENLNIVRRIRNALAHAKRVVTFEHELIKAELRQIVPVRGKDGRYKELQLAKNLHGGGRHAFLRLFREIQFELIDTEVKFAA